MVFVRLAIPESQQGDLATPRRSLVQAQFGSLEAPTEAQPGVAGVRSSAVAPRALTPSDRQALLKSSATESATDRTRKRASDVVVASAMIVVTAPVMCLIALLIRLDSPGPALFAQRRLGKDLREFNFLKFRTMVTDARERFPELYEYRFEGSDARVHQFKTTDDPRLTRVGRFIRRTSLDELPNLFCVIKGEMSMVGPRPELPELLPYYRPEEICKFAVLPGVTGLAQISGRNMLLWAETNALDVEYVHRRTLRYDFGILFRTVGTVVRMIGAL